MANWSTLASTLTTTLKLTRPPIAIAFPDKPPSNVPHISAAEAASCAYWPAAAEGKVFYTEASEHYNCPIGAYTHGVPLPPEQAQQLQGVVQMMVGLEYIKMEDVPAIPHRTEAFGTAVYAPLAKTPCDPDVVLMLGNVKQMMLLAEAAQAAGVADGTGVPAMGRPTCAVLPLAIQSGKMAVSFGCIGNRVYTGAADEEAYCAIPGQKLAAVVEKLGVITRANQELETFHTARRSILSPRP